MKVLKVSVLAKCSDMCQVELSHEDGSTTFRDGYVPDFFPGEHFGDYIELEIDPLTGIIMNWDTTITAEQMVSDLEDKV